VLFLFENYAFDTDRRELRHGTVAVPVEPQVFDLLAYLIKNRERVASKDDLVAAIWGGRIVSESTLTTRINAARGAIGDSGAEQRLIKTLARKGLRFVGDVREEARPDKVTPIGRGHVATQQPNPELSLPDKPSIAVLPFANLSGDPQQDYFSDGITEDIITETLHRDCAEIAVLEEISDQPAGASGDDDSVRLGQGLQPGGEIGCITGDIVLDDLAADDNQPGGNPDPHVKLFGLIELRHPTDQRQPASRGALGVVLVRLRIAEINQHAVAHVAGDKPAKTLDNLCDAAMIGADDLAQILGIESRRERRRADQVAEHDGELAPLGGRRSRRRFGYRTWIRAQCGDRCE
jgi:DNA-binding winged helix-turn-helix (wHTH) protein